MRYCLAILLFLSFHSIFGQAYQTETGKAIFLSKAPLNEFTGESEVLQGLIDLEKNLVDFYLDLNTLNTGIGLRDRHMRDNYLETEKYPFAEFTGKMINVPDLQNGQSKAVSVNGKFKIHGVERDVRIEGELQQMKNGDLLLKAGFDVLLGDYDIPIPKLVFYELADKQEVSIEAVLKPKKK
ncbi:YceI-like domain-containing protein [Algoriphagus faecimaris]|uniref:YceI-like domain-containing protein n=1 Tax=Algoriphagus faecimaris TaxID=686796 RepID=A0A1G6WT26_9BACT|nr:YceI family protein [Algoriphagus faecimaris]SDD69032.1 YceI-like domain-containing protein [Algoriphagus faecimaris]